METEISLLEVIVNVREPRNRTLHAQPATWRQRMDTTLREIFEGHGEFLGATPD